MVFGVSEMITSYKLQVTSYKLQVHSDLWSSSLNNKAKSLNYVEVFNVLKGIKHDFV